MPCSTRRRITSPPTRSSSRTARSSPRRSAAASVAPVDDDLQAAQYELADEAFGAAGYDWYEVSNWARDPASRSRHNLAYWLGHDWWGVGPGAHSHVGGVRWWNVKHPSAYAERIAAGVSPAAAPRGARRASSAAPSGCCCAPASGTGSRSPSSAQRPAPAVAGADRRRSHRRPGGAGRHGGADPARTPARGCRGAGPDLTPLLHRRATSRTGSRAGRCTAPRGMRPAQR